MAARVKPHKLSFDVFTPLTRTPWAGSYIADQLKSKVIEKREGLKVGESWEFSCDPDFPSFLLENNHYLSDFFKQRGVSCDLLVKLLNAAMPLSLQVHPHDGYSGLKAHESSKPESWYILHAEKGSGLYLGFHPGITREDLKRMLLKNENIAPLLQFVPVQPGDFFVIDAGVVHAIGAGVTLVEPQQVMQGKSGKTYRLWDWNRRYNEAGEVDQQNGRLRELHIEESLDLFDPSEQCGDAFISTLRRQPEVGMEMGLKALMYPELSYAQLKVYSSEDQAGVLPICVNFYSSLIVTNERIEVDGISFVQGECGMLEPGSYDFKFGPGTEFMIIESR